MIYPSIVNPLRWTIEEKAKREIYKCQHRHSGITHPVCYNEAYNIKERVVCVDIEAGGLKADYEILYAWCIKPLKGEIISAMLSESDLKRGQFDRRIVKEFIKEIWNYDRVIAHYGFDYHFDIPFIRSRALTLGLGEDFPGYGMMWRTDVWSIAKAKMALSSNRQGKLGWFLHGKDIKTYLDANVWRNFRYLRGNERKLAADKIMKHCKNDVMQLEQNYLAVRKFIKERRVSW